MKSIILAVYDKKTCTYDQPFTVRHLGDAIREWDVVRKNEQTKFGKHPEDFDLFQIGLFDDETAVLTEKKEHISSGITASDKPRTGPTPVQNINN